MHDTSGGTNQHGAVIASLRALLEEAEDAWNRGDAERYGEFFTEDASYVGRAGHVFEGRAAIRAGHAEAFAGPFRGSRLKIRPTHVRLLDAGLAIAHLDVVTVHNDGTATHAVVTALLTHTRESWRLLCAHTSQVG